MKHFHTLLCSAIAALTLPSLAIAGNTGRLYGKLYVGAAYLSNKDFDQSGISSMDSTGDSSFSAGWIGGAAVGYYFTDNIAAELTWDYRTNENDEVSFSDGTKFDEGNYASNIFFLNGLYYFNKVAGTKISPYIGAGIGFVEEIDLDIESGGVETSYSQDGEVAYQLLAGATYPITADWDVTADARYIYVSAFDLENEEGAGKIQGIDYNPLSVTVGLTYKF